MNKSNWLTDYDPSNEEFWKRSGKKIAWKNFGHHHSCTYFLFRNLVSLQCYRYQTSAYWFSIHR